MALLITDREQRLFLLATQCFESGEWPKVDYAKLAEIGGWKTKASATTAWCNLKKKLITATSQADKPKGETSDDGKKDKLPVTGKRGRSTRGAKADEGGDAEIKGEDDNDEATVPEPKKQRAGRKKAAAADEVKEEEAVKPEIDEEGQVVEEAPATKKRGRGRAAKGIAAAKNPNVTAETAGVAATADGEAEGGAETAAPKKRGRGRTAKAGGKAGGKKAGAPMEGAEEDEGQDAAAAAMAGEEEPNQGVAMEDVQIAASEGGEGGA